MDNDSKISNAIYYCINGQARAGGEFVNEEHVQALRELGYRAYLLYISNNTNQQRFNASAPVVICTNNTVFHPNDVVVVPEPWRWHLETFSRINVNRVMHCQNPYYLFHGIDDISTIRMLGYKAVLSCSDFTSTTLRKMGYLGDLYTIRPFVPDDFSAHAKNSLQIAYMPRKRPTETVFLKGLFHSLYPEFKHVPWVPIDQVSRLEAAKIMRESAIFASFSFIEGLGLPPIEAMASGCIVAGFDGHGGLEYAHPANGFWAPEGNYFEFAHCLAQAVRAFNTPAWHSELKKSCALTISAYTRDIFKEKLDMSWKSILGDKYNDYLLVAN